MIEWINTNSDYLLVLLTTIYVVATISILLVMSKTNRIYKEVMEQTAELEKARLRPYVSIFLKLTNAKNDPNGLPSGYLFLKNSGITQAYNVSVSMTPEIYYSALVGGEEEKKKIKPYFIENITQSIAPNIEISDGIGFISAIYNEFDIQVFTGEIKYSDENQKEYIERFTLDFEAMKNATPYIQE